MRVLVTRPRRDTADLTERLKARGHRSVPAPLLEIFSEAEAARLPVDPAALLFTSANAVHALDPLPHLPVFAVGTATAAAAQARGYREIQTADGDGPALLDLIRDSVTPEAGILLHARGRDLATPIAPALEAAGYRVAERIVYRAERVAEFPAPAAREIQDGRVDAALFYSARTAAAFAALLPPEARSGLSRMRALALGASALAELAELGFGSLEQAARPDSEALLDLLDAGPVR